MSLGDIEKDEIFLQSDYAVIDRDTDRMNVKALLMINQIKWEADFFFDDFPLLLIAVWGKMKILLEIREMLLGNKMVI